MKNIILILISLVSVVILWLNIKLHNGNYSDLDIKSDIICQLIFLKSELKENSLGARMQQQYPEGFVFINVLYGLSWCELALSDSSKNSNLKDEALKEAIYVYDEINSENAKWTFDSTLSPTYGMFYFGWKNYLLSKILSLDTNFKNSDSFIESFSVECETLNNIIKDSENPYLQSYDGQAWPADMFVAVAALNNYDKLFGSKYENGIKYWIKKVQARLDTISLMIPHKVDALSGYSVQGVRGSSMSLILKMLSEIDPIFAAEQFNLFKISFASSILGLPYIREHPKGHHDYEDIDSGPVILGLGFSATIATVGNFSIFGLNYLSERLYKTINTFGIEITSGNKKKYLFGKAPIADALIAWGRAFELRYYKSTNNSPDIWGIKFHIVSILIIIFLWLLYFSKAIIKIASKTT